MTFGFCRTYFSAFHYSIRYNPFIAFRCNLTVLSLSNFTVFHSRISIKWTVEGFFTNKNWWSETLHLLRVEMEKFLSRKQSFWIEITSKRFHQSLESCKVFLCNWNLFIILAFGKWKTNIILFRDEVQTQGRVDGWNFAAQIICKPFRKVSQFETRQNLKSNI